jgi:hypothetical protein
MPRALGSNRALRITSWSPSILLQPLAADDVGGRYGEAVPYVVLPRMIANNGEVRLDDNETRISGARRADVTGVGAWEPSCRGLGIAKTLKKRQHHPRQGSHPVDVG